MHIYNSSYMGGICNRIKVSSQPRVKTQAPAQKITKAKKDWNVAQVEECLPASTRP
jgi:hypothetical protein